MYFRSLMVAACSLVPLANVAHAQMPAPTPLMSMHRLAPAGSPKIRVRVDSIKYRHMIPSEYAFCKADGHGGGAAAPNKSPRISWSKGPKGTQSYAVIIYDTDSPTEHREWMNQKGHTLTAAIKRKIFFHMAVVDIPANVAALPKGAESDARVVHGKQAPAKVGIHGANDYTQAFAANEALKGTYYGYDGPCSPWNDDNTHHYHFTVYALSVPSLNLHGDFSGEAAVAAMEGKVLAQGELLGVYSTNPAVIAKLKK
ncbi:MAG TPA: YbhB/YbcL family Raf kinase inhibitor-like protein [Burkholderiales bacterium]|nr:YbhB/YbcL family Raf kinase inhibitor-like protein [Burkholderiales bacterium]